MANVETMLRRTSSKMGEDFETADVIDWFNDCLDEITDVLYLPATATITVSADGTYTLPPNFHNWLTVYTNPAGATIPVDTGSGIGYTLVGSKLHLRGDTLATLYITYNRRPARITSDPKHVPDIPEQFHRIFEHYACFSAMLSDEEHDRASIFHQQYLKVRVQLQAYMGRQRAIYRPIGEWGVVR